MQQVTESACERCGAPSAYGRTVCPQCGGLVHERRVNELAADAARLESANPAAAAGIWREVLDLVPPGSPQHDYALHRLATLGVAIPIPPPANGVGAAPWNIGVREIPPTLPYARRRAVPPPDPWPVAVAKTVGSMAISVVVYYFIAFQNLTIAIGFVVLMLIHEMGHVLAVRYYGLSASPPIFIPFIGALIKLRESPPNALVESVVGIGGPLLGTVGAFGCYGLALATHGDMRTALMITAYLAFMLNLFNMLPVPPLDGGRVTAAITPWLWIAGLVGLGAYVLLDARSSGSFGLIVPALIVIYALPRIRATLRARGRNSPYYQVSRRASWTMAGLYVWLGLVLVFMFHHLGGMMFLRTMAASS